MKSALLFLLTFVAATGQACPNITGTFKMDNKGTTLTLLQDGCNKITEINFVDGQTFTETIAVDSVVSRLDGLGDATYTYNENSLVIVMMSLANGKSTKLKTVLSLNKEANLNYLIYDCLNPNTASEKCILKKNMTFVRL